LAITGTKRTPVLPDLPTFAEAGADHPDMEFRSWWGLLVPAGTPAPIVKTLNGALVKALRSPDLVERLEKLNIEPRTSTPEEFAKFMRSETTKWAQVIKRAGIQPE
jgi:tripartite-type tricarboxylate transporter receptor subunit TctC